MKTIYTKKILIISIIAILLVIFSLIFKSSFVLNIKGLSFITNNTKVFEVSGSHMIAGEYSFSVNLGNVNDSIGKVVYKDEKNLIYISSIIQGDETTGGYRIQFRSQGYYNKDYAELVSGIMHYSNDEGHFHNMAAKMTSKYRNKTYTCNVMGITGINYKDGDSFSFYIFPNEAYENKEISFNETGIVELTVSNLYRNIWNKK